MVPGLTRSATAVAMKNTGVFCTTDIPYSSSIRQRMQMGKEVTKNSQESSGKVWAWAPKNMHKYKVSSIWAPPETKSPISCPTSEYADAGTGVRPLKLKETKT